MEEKNTNELTDEMLDAVTGGAFSQYNEETGNYDVIGRNRECLASCQTEEEARLMAVRYSQADPPVRGFHFVDPSSAYKR